MRVLWHSKVGIGVAVNPESEWYSSSTVVVVAVVVVVILVAVGRLL